MIEVETTAAGPVQTKRRGRRKYERSRLVYRLVHVECLGSEGDEGLARCRNISDSGLKLDLSMPVEAGSRLRVAFSAAHVFEGTVVWTKPGECGVWLDARIDSQAILRESAADTRARGFPGLRLSRDLLATLRCDGMVRKTRVHELTQYGLKLTHDGDVYPDAILSVRLGGDRERHGVVRSSTDNVADIVLLEPFSVGELGSINELAPVAEEPRRIWA